MQFPVHGPVQTEAIATRKWADDYSGLLSHLIKSPYNGDRTWKHNSYKHCNVLTWEDGKCCKYCSNDIPGHLPMVHLLGQVVWQAMRQAAKYQDLSKPPTRESQKWQRSRPDWSNPTWLGHRATKHVWPDRFLEPKLPIAAKITKNGIELQSKSIHSSWPVRLHPNPAYNDRRKEKSDFPSTLRWHESYRLRQSRHWVPEGYACGPIPTVPRRWPKSSHHLWHGLSHATVPRPNDARGPWRHPDLHCPWECWPFLDAGARLQWVSKWYW